LAEGVTRLPGGAYAATEWRIEDAAVPVGSETLHVRGRIDLLLGPAATLDDLWLVDYKTGNRSALRTADIEKGEGLQLALYALALRASGANEVGLSLLTPALRLEEPQIRVGDLDALAGLWRGLLHVQNTGIFGMRGPLRQEFGFSQEYPLATLAIDPDILAEKWALTHPELSPAESDS
jgi:hypothetical protein